MSKHWQGALAQFLFLFIFWLVLSDQWRPLFFVLGAASAAGVTALTHELVRDILHHPMGSLADKLRRAWYGVVYVAWLASRVVVASLELAYYAVSPSKLFQPRYVRFRTTMQRPLSRVVLAGSLTLVPGTIIVRLDDDLLLVHTLLPNSADDLASARMQNLIARFVGEAPEAPPEMAWGPLIEEAVR
jgi:multicomponent Na+:H+ antiporter subunit E